MKSTLNSKAAHTYDTHYRVQDEWTSASPYRKADTTQLRDRDRSNASTTGDNKASSIVPHKCYRIPTSDEEIVDVFLEEVGELRENIDIHMKTWKNHPGDKKTLTEIRRSFHTLKGSGRMVKAIDLSEVAWNVENMLNQAIVGTVPVSEIMIKLVADVHAQIPRMVDAFMNRRSIAGDGNIVRLMKLADTLATERKPAQVSAPLAASAVGGKQQFKLYDFNLKLERCMQRADEALHRSEMALQRARRISTLSEVPNNAAGKRDCCTNVDQIDERINRLSKEISDMRRESKNSQIEPILHQSEINQRVEQRVRARLAPMELLRMEIQRDIEENRRAVTTIRRFGWLALISSAFIGGVIATGLLVSILSIG